MSPRERRTTTAIPRLPVSSGEFDGFVRDLLERVEQMALQARPTMGTVTAVQGGELVIHIDGERISRTVGFARKKGVKYVAGDRVKLSLLRNDEYVVDGLVGSDDTDRSVGREQIASGAISSNEIAVGAVGQFELSDAMFNRIMGALQSIPNDSIARVHVKTNAIGPDELDWAAVQSGHLSTEVLNYLKTIFALKGHVH